MNGQIKRVCHYFTHYTTPDVLWSIIWIQWERNMAGKVRTINQSCCDYYIMTLPVFIVPSVFQYTSCGLFNISISKHMPSPFCDQCIIWSKSVFRVQLDQTKHVACAILSVILNNLNNDLDLTVNYLDLPRQFWPRVHVLSYVTPQYWTFFGHHPEVCVLPEVLLRHVLWNSGQSSGRTFVEMILLGA